MCVKNEVKTIDLQENEFQDFSQEETAALQLKLWGFLEKHTKKYTSGNSSSIPLETAQELLASICFTLGIDLNGNPMELKKLLDRDLEEIYEQGVKKLEAKIEYGKKLWETACLSAPNIHNLSMIDTLKDMKKFWKWYDYQFFAHEIPCNIDYQLCQPVSETVLGIDYIIEYLKRILIENEFLCHFDNKKCIRLLKSYCPDYDEMLINLYEPIATNAIGLALIDSNPLNLNISEADCNKIAMKRKDLPKDKATELLKRAAKDLCVVLGLDNPAAQTYLTNFAANLMPRIEASLSCENLQGVFLAFGKTPLF